MNGRLVYRAVREGLKLLREHAPEEVGPLLADEVRMLHAVRPDEARAFVAGVAADLAANAAVPWPAAVREALRKNRTA